MVLPLLYVAVVANMYVFSGAYLSMATRDHVSRPYDPRSSRAQNCAQLALEVSALSVGSYLLRSAVRRVAARAFEGPNFDPSAMNETNGGIVLSMAIFAFMKDPVQDKLRGILQRA